MLKRDRQHMLAASRDALRRLGAPRLSEVTPSRRDFAQYVTTQKTELAIVAAIRRGAGGTGSAALVEYARACDDAEVAALAVRAGADDVSLADMADIASATTAPILLDAFILDRSQLYAARLHGGDAALFPASDLDAEMVRDLVTVASSLHMASVIEVLSVADLDKALALPHVILGIACERADGSLDVEHTRQLAQRIGPTHATIALPEVTTRADADALRGVCDAVVVGELLRTATDLAVVVGQLTRG